jgi:hypothetical protein
VFLGRAEARRAHPHRQRVARKAEVAHDQLVRRKPRVQSRLQPAVVLHPFGQRVADDRDAVAGLQLELEGGQKDQGHAVT